MKKALCFIILTLSCIVCKSQNVESLMKDAQELMAVKKYNEANEKFLQIANLGKVLPDDYSFFLGVSLFQLRKQDQSELFLRKYISLQGRLGKHYHKARHLLRVIDGIETLTPEDPDILESPDSVLIPKKVVKRPCQDGEMVVCPVCNGTGLIMQEGAFRTNFVQCPYSNKKGLMTCDQYILYKEGHPEHTEEDE